MPKVKIIAVDGLKSIRGTGSQQAMADEVRKIRNRPVHRMTWAKWEHGRAAPDLDDLYDIQQAHSLSDNQILAIYRWWRDVIIAPAPRGSLSPGAENRQGPA